MTVLFSSRDLKRDNGSGCPKAQYSSISTEAILLDQDDLRSNSRLRESQSRQASSGAVLRQCDGSAKSLATERPAGCRSRIRARPALVAMLRQEAVLILAIPPGGDTELRQISCAPPREIRRRADLPQAIFGRPRQLFAHTSINSGSGINSANVMDPPKALPLSDPRAAGAASEPGRLWWQCSVEKLS